MPIQAGLSVKFLPNTAACKYNQNLPFIYSFLLSDRWSAQTGGNRILVSCTFRNFKRSNTNTFGNGGPVKSKLEEIYRLPAMFRCGGFDVARLNEHHTLSIACGFSGFTGTAFLTTVFRGTNRPTAQPYINRTQLSCEAFGI